MATYEAGTAGDYELKVKYETIDSNAHFKSNKTEIPISEIENVSGKLVVSKKPLYLFLGIVLFIAGIVTSIALCGVSSFDYLNVLIGCICFIAAFVFIILYAICLDRYFHITINAFVWRDSPMEMSFINSSSIAGTKAPIMIHTVFKVNKEEGTNDADKLIAKLYTIIAAKSSDNYKTQSYSQVPSYGYGMYPYGATPYGMSQYPYAAYPYAAPQPAEPEDVECEYAHLGIDLEEKIIYLTY